MDTEVVTVATHSEGTFDNLINNDYNIKVKVLGFGKKWTGFNMKFKLVYDYIKNLNDDKIIIFIDAFDSEINGTIEKAERIFKKNNYKILLSEDNPPIPNYLYSLLPWTTCKNNHMGNSGLYMGYVKYLKIMLKSILKKKCKDDQVNLNKVCKKSKTIDIDHKNEIFYNKITGKFQYNDPNINSIFISQPGTITLKRIYRAFLEYPQFYLKFLLFVYLLIIYFLYKHNQLFYIFIITFLFTTWYIKMDKSCV